MLQRRRGAAVEMTVSMVEMMMMMMMIPMKSSSMMVTMATISPSGREFPQRISACRRALFSLVFFRLAEAAVSILDASLHLRVLGR